MDDLEQGEVVKEQVAEPTSETEQGKEPTSEKPTEPTSEEVKPVFTQEDVNQAVKKGKAEVQSVKDTENNELTERIATITAERETDKRNAELAIQEQREVEDLGDTKEVRDWQGERRELAEAERSFATYMQGKNVEVMEAQAYKLGKENNLTMEEVLNLKAETPEEMRVKAKTFAQEKIKAENASLKAEVEELRKSPQEIDSSAPGVSGVDLSSMSPSDTILYALEHPQKKKEA